MRWINPLVWLERLYEWWNTQRRILDVDILWPSCKRASHSLEQAREMFIVHMASDPAYSGMDEEELTAFVHRHLV